jgi:hypothetical protein
MYQACHLIIDIIMSMYQACHLIIDIIMSKDQR